MSLIIDLENFQYPNALEIADWINKRPKTSKSNSFSIVNELKPCDLYLYFYAKFGPPNGFQNIFRNDNSDNLIHWDWTFKHKNGLLSFWGMNLRTEVLFIGGWDFEKIDKAQVIQSIKNDFKNFGSEMSRLRNEMLENWETFVNPYKSLDNSVRMLEEELKELRVCPATDRFPDYEFPSDAIKIGETIDEIQKRYIRAFGISKSLQALTPILAEAFLNLLLMLLMKKEILENKRLKESVMRANIDIKIQSLGLNCNGFAQSVDWKSEPCMKYSKVVNNRNDLLHGNIVISKLKTGEIFFNGKVPVFKEYSSLWEQLFERRLKASGFNQLDEDLKAVRDFISYVLDCLDVSCKTVITQFMNKSELGRNTKNGRFGILLPDYVVDIMPELISNTKQ